VLTACGADETDEMVKVRATDDSGVCGLFRAEDGGERLT